MGKSCPMGRGALDHFYEEAQKGSLRNCHNSLMNEPKTLVVIPTYNEIESVPRLILKVSKLLPDVHMLIVDDGSPDGTADAVEALNQAEHKGRIFVLRRTEKAGLGAAYLAGFEWGFVHGYEAMVEMDADGSHRPEDLVTLLKVFYSDPSIDLVIGSRWIKGGSVVNWAKKRELLSRSANKYAGFMLGSSVKDMTAGFRVFKSSALQRIDFSTVKSQGYCFQIEMARKVMAFNGKIKEVPITFVEREFGVSKMDMKIVIEAMLRVTLWGLHLIK
jgi:dolichol-phosphate mannosyltransferase